MLLQMSWIGGEFDLGEVDGGELEELARLVGEVVDDSEGADDGGWRDRGPLLREELEAPKVRDELRTVTHRVARVELIRYEVAEGAVHVSLRYRVEAGGKKE